MKCKIPEISWHNRDPVLSVDIQPNKNNESLLNKYRLASGGTDAHVLIWYMKMSSGEKGDVELDLAADLTRHQRAVNVVKWSPNGELLASGDDESVVFIWKLKSDSEPLNILDTANDQDKEVWITLKVLRGHMEDIYDLSWAPNSLFLVTGSVDNTAIMWDITKGKSTAILNDHKGFVQGVAWDPKNQYVATLSTDRYLRIFDIQSKKVLYRISKGSFPVPEDNDLHGKNVRLFHDDTLQTFFRRLCFTPDGKLLLTPSGVADYDGCARPLNTTYAFSRYGFRQPAIVLPCPDQYTVAVSCCPLLYRLRPYNPQKNPPVVPLPYRMIFAVATKSSVYFYDTQQNQPFALISNIHYTRLTDITWSQDGLVVVVSSTDGFCSLITFEKGELGEEFEDSDAVLEVALAQVNLKNSKSKKQKENEGGAKSRKPSVDTNNQAKENKPVQLEVVEENEKDEIEKQSVPSTDQHECEDDAKTQDEKKQNILRDVRLTTESKSGKVSTISENNEKPKSIEIKRRSQVSLASGEKPATLIAIKRKPGINNKQDSKQIDSENKSEELTTPPKSSKPAINAKVLTGDIILDKEILSSDEKFESPEKKSRPATPISVRRHPRNSSQTPTQVCQSPTTFAKIIKPNPDEHNNKASPAQSKTPVKDMKAKPIAVRRIPRSLISASTIVHTPAVIEEAMDAWPLPKESENVAENADKTNIETSKETGVTPLPSDETVDRSEDIRLVYEETVEEPPILSKKESTQVVPSENVSKISTSTEMETESNPTTSSQKNPNQETPNGKTPKRVALRTISTPKSKKKLLE